MTTAHCARCQLDHPVEAFRIDKRTGRPHSWCRECCRDYMRQPRQRSLTAAAHQRRREQHPERIAAEQIRKKAVRRAVYAEYMAIRTEHPCRRCRRWRSADRFGVIDARRDAWCIDCRNPQPAATKPCVRCQQEYPVEQFQLMRGKYRDSWCTACRSAYNAEPRQRALQSAALQRRISTNPAAHERKKQGHRAYYQRNRERMLAQMAARPDKREASLDTRLRKLFGIGLPTYRAMVAAQNGRCAICGDEPKDHYGRLVVDHCHSTTQIRALLCAYCNTGLGHFRDSIDRLQQAITYLRRFQDDERVA